MTELNKLHNALMQSQNQHENFNSYDICRSKEQAEKTRPRFIIVLKKADKQNLEVIVFDQKQEKRKGSLVQNVEKKPD